MIISASRNISTFLLFNETLLVKCLDRIDFFLIFIL
jgi:hypothetical protein